jgi:hypothetical protein
LQSKLFNKDICLTVKEIVTDLSTIQIFLVSLA